MREDEILRVRLRLAKHLERTRRDRLLYALSVVLLTPFVVLGLVAVVALVIAVELGPNLTGGSVAVVLLGFQLVMLVAAVACADDPRGTLARGAPALVGATAVAAASGWLSLGTDLRHEHASAFWVLQGLCVLGGLAFLGRAYAPRGSYDGGGPLEDLAPDLGVPAADQGAHLLLGFLVLVPAFLLDSYAQIFASRRLFAELHVRELETAAIHLDALARDRPAEAEDALARAEPRTRQRIEELVRDLELVRPGPTGVRLSGRGRDLTD